MFPPIRRWRAVVVGIVVALVCQSAASVSAGVVAPPESEPPVTPSQLPGDQTSPLPLPSANSDSQPFWFPGVDGEAVSISSVPVRSPDNGPAAFPGTAQHPLIPLPGPVWTGMGGLLALGAIKVLRNFRRLLA